jgi:hypothetical protein
MRQLLAGLLLLLATPAVYSAQTATPTTTSKPKPKATPEIGLVGTVMVLLFGGTTLIVRRRHKKDASASETV